MNRRRLLLTAASLPLVRALWALPARTRPSPDDCILDPGAMCPERAAELLRDRRASTRVRLNAAFRIAKRQHEEAVEFKQLARRERGAMKRALLRLARPVAR